MPRATVEVESKRFDLKELEGGWIELRKLTYGEILRRRDLLQTMREAEGSPSPKRDGRRRAPRDVELNLNFSRIREFEFSRAVVDHNLEDENGKKLDLGRNYARLDPKIGQEIETYMDEMNAFVLEEDEDEDEDEDEEGSEEPSFRGSGDEGNSPREGSSTDGS